LLKLFPLLVLPEFNPHFKSRTDSQIELVSCRWFVELYNIIMI
jgi:hypothetical protein